MLHSSLPCCSEVNRALGVNVTVVVTMSDEEWKRDGERPDYQDRLASGKCVTCFSVSRDLNVQEYYGSLGITNLRYKGWDKVLFPGEEYDAKKVDCLHDELAAASSKPLPNRIDDCCIKLRAELEAHASFGGRVQESLAAGLQGSGCHRGNAGLIQKFAK